jgi:hypothetical protein
MAYIIPDGLIEFFADIGLSPNYENALYFASTSAKDSYFSNLTKIATVTAQSYTRTGRGVLKVQLPMSTMVRCGYLRFRNVSFENKWFYAFILGVDYVNNITTEVRFEIDVLTTWMGTFSLGQCFIERQHTLSDAIGANICDEGLDTGEYITEYRSNTGMLSGDWAICIFSAQTGAGAPAEGSVYCGVYSGCEMYIYRLSDFSNANAQLQQITENAGADSIACVLMLPWSYCATAIITGGSFTPFTSDVHVPKPYSDIAGYRPKNNKLYTYPYKCLSVYNSEGNSIDYKYEYFNTLPDQASTGLCNFQLKVLISSNPLIALYPVNYKGQAVAYDEQIDMRHFTACNYAIDTWKAYYAMNKSTIDYDKASTGIFGGVGIASGIISAVGSVAMGNLQGVGGGISQIASSVDTIGRKMAKHTDYQRMPNVSKGVANNDLMTADQTKDFYFEMKCITKNYAMMIDDYFTMFGYAIRQVGTPNMNARPYFTYVKTIGCTVHGELPSDDGAKIEKIFDNGVRFWKSHTNIGNYSLNNAPA